MQVSDWRSVSCTKWASCNVSSPNRSFKHSKSDIPEKLGNPARLKSLIQSQENLASKRIVPSRRGTFLVLMLCFNSWWELTRRAMSSTWQISPACTEKRTKNNLKASILLKYFVRILNDQSLVMITSKSNTRLLFFKIGFPH